MEKYVISKTSDDGYKFNPVANNGENLLASEGYTAKANAKKGIESVRNNADSEVVVKED